MTAAGALSTRWASLARRERLAIVLAASILGVALLWWVALAPALRTLRTAEAQHAGLDRQLERVLGQQAQATALRGQPRLGYEEASRALEQSTRQQFGAAGWISLAGDRATIRLTGASGDALAQWLAQARINARALPTEARMSRNAAGLWEGSIVMALPPR